MLLPVLCFFPLIITHAEGGQPVGELYAFMLRTPADSVEKSQDKPGRDTAFTGAGGEKLTIAWSSPEEGEVFPPGRLRFEVKALPFDRAVLLLLEPPNSLDIKAYKIYVSTNQSGEDASYYFLLAATLQEYEIEFVHDGLTNFIGHYYIVTAVDRKGNEHAVSVRIPYAVPGTTERGYLDEAVKR